MFGIIIITWPSILVDYQHLLTDGRFRALINSYNFFRGDGLQECQGAILRTTSPGTWDPSRNAQKRKQRLVFMGTATIRKGNPKAAPFDPCPPLRCGRVCSACL